MYFNVLLLNRIGIQTVNKYDTSRRLNAVKNKNIAYYKYQGRCRFWFIHKDHIELIQRRR